MVTLADIEEVVRGAGTKRQAAERLGTTAADINSRLSHACRSSQLYEQWKRLRSDGAYSRHGGPIPPRPTAALPTPSRRQSYWDATVAEALADHPLDSSQTQRWNITRILWGLYYVTGTLDWSRGWVRSLMSALAESGVPQTTPSSARWYRSTMAEHPEQYASSCPSDDLMRDLADGHCP